MCLARRCDGHDHAANDQAGGTGARRSVHVTMMDSTNHHETLLDTDSSGSILICRPNWPALGLRTDSIAHMEYLADDLGKTVLGYAAVIVCLNVLIWAASPWRWW